MNSHEQTGGSHNWRGKANWRGLGARAVGLAQLSLADIAAAAHYKSHTIPLEDLPPLDITERYTSRNLPYLASNGVQAAHVEAEQARRQTEIDEILAGIPNIPADDAPTGVSERDNVEIRRVGEPRRMNAAMEHFALGEALGLMDFETAAKMSGSRFVLLSGALARMERALANLMLDTHTEEFAYTECAPPLLVKDAAAFGTGQLPKFEDDLFHTVNGYWLIPTAEVSLTNIHAGTIVDEESLPRRYTAWTPCFRSEAGAAGRDTRGMIRMHQFSKVELVSIAAPEASEAEHERMTACASARRPLASRTAWATCAVKPIASAIAPA